MIKIYSKAGCPHCDSAKALLECWGIQYEEVRIDIDDDARNFLILEGHRTVPQLYVGDELLIEGGHSALAASNADFINSRVKLYEGRKE